LADRNRWLSDSPQRQGHVRPKQAKAVLPHQGASSERKCRNCVNHPKTPAKDGFSAALPPTIGALYHVFMTLSVF